MRRKRKALWIGVGVLLLSSSVCSRWWRKPKPRGELTPAERAAIAAYTHGAISRESPIRVVFTAPIVDASRLGAPLDRSPFDFDPSIKGVTVWTAASQIEFRPAERLPDGKTYAATLELQDLLKGKFDLKRFEFVFSTMRQTFDVTIDGLEAADPQDVKRQKLTGKLVTADVDNAAKIEQMLKAAHGGRDLEIDWSHDPDRRVHSFAVKGIVRDEDSSTLHLSWDGRPIGVEKKETREVAIPGLNTFTVDQARAIQDREQYIELRFTDPLRSPQNLKGLIAVGDRDDLRFVISGNIVEVYSAASFKGDQAVRIASGIRNVLGYRMREARELTVSFEALKPQVRFVGKGVIVPTSTGQTITIEAVNTRAVIVEAMRIPEVNVPQFLQVNDLEGERELNRVGRVVWKKTIPLEITPDKENRPVAFGLDLTPLTSNNPGGLYRLTLSFKRPHIIWTCGEADDSVPSQDESIDFDGGQESSYWDLWQQGDYWESYEHRHDPCHPGYYRSYYDHKIDVSRNVLVSDLGLLAKAGEDDTVMVVVNNLQTTAPVSGARVAIEDYQLQTLASGSTDRNGFVRLKVESKPFLAVVRNAGQVGYLKLDDGSALSMAHFDVAGARVPKGLKGFLYGERGVWRPGDTLHLTFILFDPDRRLPEKHPIRFDLINSRGQLVRSVTRTRSQDGFSTFEIATSPDAPTGNYTGRVTVGGATFEKVLKIETVMPNRLKIAMDFETPMIQPGGRLSSVLKSAWLHGALARNLKADVEVALSSSTARFDRYSEYVFDDPTRRYETERRTVFEGQLDEKGEAEIVADVSGENVAPGMLNAHFTTRVFEPGGAFSIDRFSIPYSPYSRYVGVRAPKGDKARGMLLTDGNHELSIVAVDSAGRTAGEVDVEVKLYKVDWRWWWEKGEEDLSAYAESRLHNPLLSDVVRLKNGVGAWHFEIKYPDWGRYLILAADREGGHRTGKFIYIDWPGWAGRGRKELSGGANVLSFSSDKQEYQVGETVTLTLPTPQKGRGLISIESGAKVLGAEWIEAQGAETRHTFTATADMAPNVYAHVTLLQPHGQSANDLPIRLYGVIPIKVVNPETRLKPVVECPEVFVPESTAEIAVRESSGKAMTYTVAVVDEGLLSLTRYATPNPWDHFYAREALAVKTWDVYDLVTGAYGAALERMLAIGGDEEGARAGVKRANRFPPMVRFLGPFTLDRGGKNSHKVDIPQYVGAVRVMVVAGRNGAFGAADKSAFVRRPLMILATLPRVLGPEEEVALPVSVFALEPKVKNVSVSVSTSGPLKVVQPAKKTLSFDATGDKLVSFRVSTKPSLGVARAVIRATGAGERAEQTIELDVRMSTVRAVDVIGFVLKPNASWEPPLTLPGISGTNEALLEVSRNPPIDLGRRLEYLIRYPHGCVEQTVSSVFPQLYLGELLELSPEKKQRIESNVKAGLERLKRFQTSEGGFGYWPGDNDSQDWASNYAGHFLVEAGNAGFLIPAGLREQWIKHQRRRARAWVPGEKRSELTQAYRLYTLALAGAPDLGAMNRLRESAELPVTAHWRLAAAYHIAGQPEAARALVKRGAVSIKPYRELACTYGSDLRDKAMVLEALAMLGIPEQIGPLMKEVSERLSRNDWLSTQETAYALLALSRCAGGETDKTAFGFSYSWNGGKEIAVSTSVPLFQRELEVGSKTNATLTLRNTGKTIIYPRIVMSGLPPVGQETSSSNGMKLEIEYRTMDDKQIDVSKLEQGTDFKAQVKVTNTGERGNLEEVALTHIVPSGWEIHNERMDPTRRRTSPTFDYQDIRDDRVYTYFDLKTGETKTIELLLNASYLGKYYLPMLSVEAMYDATLNARIKGQWVEVVQPGR
jgi:uncharacterized protein YfaS (alpha-2-macroglobulin family)